MIQVRKCIIENTENGEGKEEKHFCSVCRREISRDEYESYDEMCWECWDDQMTEESDTLFGDLM